MMKRGIQILVGCLSALILLTVAWPGGPAPASTVDGLEIETVPARSVGIHDLVVDEVDGALVVTGRVKRRLFSGRGPLHGTVRIEIVDGQGAVQSAHCVATDPGYLPRALSGARFSHRIVEQPAAGATVRVGFKPGKPPSPTQD